MISDINILWGFSMILRIVFALTLIGGLSACGKDKKKNDPPAGPVYPIPAKPTNLRPLQLQEKQIVNGLNVSASRTNEAIEKHAPPKKSVASLLGADEVLGAALFSGFNTMAYDPVTEEMARRLNNCNFEVVEMPVDNRGQPQGTGYVKVHGSNCPIESSSTITSSSSQTGAQMTMAQKYVAKPEFVDFIRLNDVVDTSATGGMKAVVIQNSKVTVEAGVDGRAFSQQYGEVNFDMGLRMEIVEGSTTANIYLLLQVRDIQAYGEITATQTQQGSFTTYKLNNQDVSQREFEEIFGRQEAIDRNP